MSKRILIVTNSADVHADVVVDNARARGESPFRINLDAFPRDYELDLEHGPRWKQWAGSLTAISSSDTLPISGIGAVWVRKTADFSFLTEDLQPQERAYAAKETEHILFSLFYGLDCYWMSHPVAIRSALWKGEQLLRAARMGFQVPKSIISNRPESARQFWNAVDGEMIFKSLSTPFLAADVVDTQDCITTGLPTTRISREDAEAFDAVQELPCFFQGYVPKRYELRVTVIGDTVFAARIHSQDDERTRTDYRDFSAEVRYEAVELPAEVERLCRDFVASYGLQFGALDIIVTPDDEYVFLENNPGGQFLFVEQLVPELRMMDAVTECLIEGAKAGG